MIVCNLDAKKRINCLLSVGDNVWVGCIENIQIRRALVCSFSLLFIIIIYYFFYYLLF